MQAHMIGSLAADMHFHSMSLLVAFQAGETAAGPLPLLLI